MRKIKGNDLIVMLYIDGEWKAVAFATSCELDISADMIETSSQDTGKWKTYRKRKKGWKISSGHIKGDVKKTPDLFELLESDKSVQVCMTTVEAHPDIITEKEYKIDGRYMLTGLSLVTRMTVTARKGDMATMNIEFQGNGPLKQIWAQWIFEDGVWNDTDVWLSDGVWN